MDYIITNITLWHITILFNSGEMKKKEEKQPKTKAFRIQYKRSEKYQPDKLFYYVSIINPKTINLCRPDQEYEHKEIIFKAD